MTDYFIYTYCLFATKNGVSAKASFFNDETPCGVFATGFFSGVQSSCMSLKPNMESDDQKWSDSVIASVVIKKRNEMIVHDFYQ